MMMKIKFPKWAKLLWIAIILGLALGFCSSCSPVKKLDKLHKNHPYLFTKKLDTLKVYDTTTVVINGVHVDTLTHIRRLYRPEGFTFQKENLKVHIAAKNDTVYIEAETDTVVVVEIKEILMPYSKYETYKTPISIKEILSAVFLIIFILIASYLYYRSQRKKQ